MKDKIKIVFVNYDTKSLKISQQTLQQLGLNDFSYTLNMENYLVHLDKKQALIFMDCNDPLIASIEMIKRIKTLSPKTKVIALLDRSNLNLAQAALKNGAFDYILKGATEDRQIQKIMIEVQQSETLKILYKKPGRSSLEKIWGQNRLFPWKFIFNKR